MASSKSPPLGNSNSTSSARTTAAAANKEPSIQVEFALNVNMPEDLNKVDRLLRNNGYRLLSTDFEDKTIKLELESRADGRMRSVQRLQEFIEKETGFLAVIKGVGELASAVSELRPSNISIRTGINVHGVIRLSQLDNNFCYADVSLGYNHHKLERPVLLSLAIHEYGNLEGDEYAHIGEPIVDIDKLETSDTDVTLSKAIGNCNVAEMIGRSIALTRLSRESKDKTVISAGVVARAATVQQNKKQVCSCSGKTLWEERIDRKKAEQGGQ